MGQAATRAEPVQTELYLKDAKRFLAALGVSAEDWTPRSAMWPDFCFVASPNKVEQVRHSLAGLIIDGRPVEFSEASAGFFRVRLGHANLGDRDVQVSLHGEPHTFAELGLENFQIDEGAPATAYHVPQGVLLSFNPRTAPVAGSRTQISTCDVAPLILRHLHATLPQYMRRRLAKAA
jgi:hypothetical protein